MLIFLRMLLCTMFLSVSSCALSSSTVLSSTDQATISKTEQSWQQVTVKYLNFEGGFYGLVTEKGIKLLPMGLPKKYKIEGTILRVKGHELTEMVTIQQWGKAFKIVEIELIKVGLENKPTH